jgi:hypothetical protein
MNMLLSDVEETTMLVDIDETTSQQTIRVRSFLYRCTFVRRTRCTDSETQHALHLPPRRHCRPRALTLH